MGGEKEEGGRVEEDDYAEDHDEDQEADWKVLRAVLAENRGLRSFQSATDVVIDWATASSDRQSSLRTASLAQLFAAAAPVGDLCIILKVLGTQAACGGVFTCAREM